ncbi:hypothetical protein [Streptomyces sp. NPDC050804]|uniref:hypothetical protein n=1 Tax=Streptomyces sp. NPDC050804 TaxID=3154745 RepID=UPI003425CACC
MNVSTGAKSCFASFTDAIVKATDGRITDAPDGSRAVMSDTRFLNRLNAGTATKASVGAAALAPVSVMYANADFRGEMVAGVGYGAGDDGVRRLAVPVFAEDPDLVRRVVDPVVAVAVGHVRHGRP